MSFSINATGWTKYPYRKKKESGSYVIAYIKINPGRTWGMDIPKPTRLLTRHQPALAWGRPTPQKPWPPLGSPGGIGVVAWPGPPWPGQMAKGVWGETWPGICSVGKRSQCDFPWGLGHKTRGHSTVSLPPLPAQWASLEVGACLSRFQVRLGSLAREVRSLPEASLPARPPYTKLPEGTLGCWLLTPGGVEHMRCPCTVTTTQLAPQPWGGLGAARVPGLRTQLSSDAVRPHRLWCGPGQAMYLSGPSQSPHLPSGSRSGVCFLRRPSGMWSNKHI